MHKIALKTDLLGSPLTKPIKVILTKAKPFRLKTERKGKRTLFFYAPKIAIVAIGLILGLFDAYATATDTTLTVPKLAPITLTIPTSSPVKSIVNPGTIAVNVSIPVKHIVRVFHSKRGAK
jgi:hypothetical protein